MATGRIGVTPTLRTRWSKAPAGGTTSLSGLDDNSVSLVYDVGYEAVYRNGVLLSRTNDYTATTGNSITLIDATIAGDIIEVFGNQLLPLTNAIGNGQYNAKGALLSATAASTPAVLAVGSNNQVLTADSSTAIGLKWATPAAGGMTLLSTTSMNTGTSTVTVSSISGSYKTLEIQILNPTWATGTAQLWLSIESSSSLQGSGGVMWNSGANTSAAAISGTTANFSAVGNSNSAGLVTGLLTIHNYSSTSAYKPFSFISGDDSKGSFQGGVVATNTAIDQISISNQFSYNFNGGTILVYGIN